MDADGFAGVFPEHKYEIVKRLQGLGHLCAMSGDGANDVPDLSRANVGIAVGGATNAARFAADIVSTEPSLSTIVPAIRGSRIIFQRMRNYSIYRQEAARACAAATSSSDGEGVPITRTQLRAASIHEIMYSNGVSFICRAAHKVGFGQNIWMKPEELQRFSSIQAKRTGATLARNPGQTAA